MARMMVQQTSQKPEQEEWPRKSKVPVVREKVPGARGWRGRGGGAAALVPTVREYRGTTVQVCGLWPFSSGTSSPMIGVPIGRHKETQATVCCDPISWIQRAQLISNPSAFVLGKPGLGKSTLVRRMMLGLAGQGTNPLVLGDLKGEHVDLVAATGGQVIPLGRGRGYLNILDPGQAIEVAQLLEDKGEPEAAGRVRADAHGRRLNMVVALGARPEGTTHVVVHLTCLSTGTIYWEDGANMTCTADDEGAQAYMSLPLEAGQTTTEIKTSDPGVRYEVKANYENRTPTEWAINENGDTYGTPNDQGEPDLIKVFATNGKLGYAYSKDLQGPEINNPEEALEYMESVKGTTLMVPVYESDGETVVGEFEAGSW